MTQEYTPVVWVDETPNQPGTVINKARLDQMQTAHHYADGFEEVDTVPTADPGVDYHKVVFCTADTTFYRWDGTQWTKDVDDHTLALLEAHEADHNNPHVVTKAQVGLGNVDNKGTVSAWQTTPDNDHIPTEKLVKDSLDAKVDDTQIVSAFQGTPDNTHIASEKLVKDSLDGKVSGTGNIGGDLKPIKIVNGQAVAVTNDLMDLSSAQDVTGIKSFKANVNIGEVGSAKNLTIVGDLNITGNITQNGSSYETHAEQVFTTDDYITMRDGATAGLASGDYSGFKVKKYDGTNDGHLVIDNTGTARVGDVGDEQPLLTREESANMNNGALLKWDATNSKAVDEGTVGTDSKPIKIVNGVATAVTDELMSAIPHDLTETNLIVVFGTNAYNGEYYSSFVGLRNAHQKTITCTYLSAIGISVIDPNDVTIVKSYTGYYLKTTDSSVAGRSCVAYITFS